MPEADTLWTADDVAAFLRVSRRTVYDLPGLPSIELQGTRTKTLRRYDPEEVRTWARNRSTRAEAERRSA